MCENKDKAEACWRIGNDATERFEKRRSSEWKLLVAFWTPLLVASGYLASNKCVISLHSAIAISVVVFILAIIFSKWRIFIQEMSCLDRQKAIYWKNLYLKKCGIEPPSKYIENLYPASVLQDKSVLGIHEGVDWMKESPRGYPSVKAHLIITWLLVIGFLFLVWSEVYSTQVDRDQPVEGKDCVCCQCEREAQGIWVEYFSSKKTY